MKKDSTDELIAKYLQYCQFQKGLSEKTVKAYRIDLKQFSHYIGSDIHVCDKEQIQNYLSLLHKRYKPKSVRRKIASIKAFFGYLEDEQIMTPSPFIKLRIKLHTPFLLPKTIPLNTINLLLQCAYKRKNSLINDSPYRYASCLRDIAVLELLFATGIRVSELCSIEVNAIDLTFAFTFNVASVN